MLGRVLRSNDLVQAGPEPFGELYEELRRLAHARLRRTEPLTLLDTTALVHETFLRLSKMGTIAPEAYPNFLAYASRVMRSVIVDYVRQRRARVTLETSEVGASHAAEEEIARVNEALDELSKVDERLVKVVEMRYFAGLTEADIASALGVTERTVRRDWQKAKMLLMLALK